MSRGSGNFVAQQDLAKPRLDLALFLVVEDRIAPRVEYPEPAALLLAQDAARDEAFQRLFLVAVVA